MLFFTLGNRWNFQKFVPYDAMLDAIRVAYPDVVKIDDHPNETSKVKNVALILFEKCVG